MYKSAEWVSSKGDTILFGLPDYPVQRISGMGNPSTDIQTQRAPFQDGVTIIDTLFEPRVIPIEFTILGDTVQEKDINKRNILKAFNPKLGEGTLKVKNFAEQEYSVQGISENGVNLRNSAHGDLGYTHQVAMIRLICPDPFWHGAEYTLTLSNGNTVTLNNDGDYKAPLLLLLEGPATGPKITNVDTGEYIAFKEDYVIDDGDVLLINTAFGRKEITLHKANDTTESVFHQLQPESILFELITGENNILYELQAGTGEGALKWNRRYIGI